MINLFPVLAFAGSRRILDLSEAGRSRLILDLSEAGRSRLLDRQRLVEVG